MCKACYSKRKPPTPMTKKRSAKPARTPIFGITSVRPYPLMMRSWKASRAQAWGVIKPMTLGACGMMKRGTKQPRGSLR